MAVIGELTVNLNAKTAEFHDSLGKANADLDDFGNKGKQAGEKMGASMTEARGGLMLTEHLLGVPLPRHLNSLIAQIPGVGAAFATMLPVVGVLLAIEIIGKLIKKHEEARQKMVELALAQQEAGMHGEEAFNKIADKIVGVQKEVDALRKDHLAVLHDELVLLDHSTLNELKTEFASFAKDADAALSKIQSHWYELWMSQSVGTKEAFDTEKEKLDELATAANKPGLNDAARATAAQAYTDELDSQLARQKEIVTLERVGAGSLTGLTVAVNKVKAAREELAVKYGIKGVNEDTLKAEGIVLKAYQNQKDVLVESLAYKKAQADADKEKAANAINAEEDSTYKRKDEDRKKDATAAEKQADENRAAAVAALRTAEEEKIEATKQGTSARVAAIDAALKEETQEYQQGTAFFINLQKQREKAVQEERKEEEAATAASLRAQEHLEIEAASERFKDDTVISNAQFAQRAEQISAAVAHETMSQRQGTQARIALIKEELATKLAELEQEKEAKQAAILADIRAEAAVAEAAHVGGDQAGEITAQTKLNELNAQRNALLDQTAAKEQAAGIASQTAVNKEIAAMTQLEKATTKWAGTFNSDVAKSVVEGKNFEKAMRSMAQGMIESAIEYEMKRTEMALVNMIRRAGIEQTGVAEHAAAQSEKTAIDTSEGLKQRFQDAKTAAANAMSDHPFPLNIAIAGAVFAATLAFAQGGEVPGYGSGDTVPAMLTPAETVVTKALTQQVAQSQGRASGSGETHMHFSPTIHAIDADGVGKMLDKHAAVFQKKMNDHIRKMNAGRR